MLKKLPVLLFLCALCIWAADFWTTKPFTEWNDKEVQKILSDSPWTEKVTVSAPTGGGPGIAESGGGGRGGGRGGSRGGPQGDSINPDSSTDGGNGGGGGGAPGGVSVTLLWQTALPVKEALIRRQYKDEAGTSPEAKARLERVEQVYVLTLIGMPGQMLGATQADRKAELIASTLLTVPGKPPVQAVDVQSSGGRGLGNVSFLFPRTTVFTADDKELEFFTKFDKIVVKKKFKLKDMVFKGKVEM